MEKKFDWLNALERGLWTGVQAPAGLALADLVVTEASMPAASYWIAAGAGVGVSILKTVGAARLKFLTRGLNRADYLPPGGDHL